METKTITYTYDPTMRTIYVIVDGKVRGGFSGSRAEKKFYEALESGADISISNYMKSEEYKKALIRRFHAALSARGVMSHKGDIISAYGVEHTTDLTIDQLKELLEKYSTQNREKRADDPARIRTLRSDLLTICQKMDIYATNDDWTKVNDFFMKYTGKLLYDLTEDELVKARKQFNSLLDWHTKKQNESNRLSKLN
jgi:hypothetical protein